MTISKRDDNPKMMGGNRKEGLGGNGSVFETLCLAAVADGELVGGIGWEEFCDDAEARR
jgi:hypothetical protein